MSAVTPERTPLTSPPALARAAVEAIGQFVGGEGSVDPWGLDPLVFDLWAGAARVGSSITVHAGGNLPDGPFLLVANRRFGRSEASVLAAAVQDLTGRRLRWASLLDVAPISTLGRRLGAVLAQPAEVTALLRAGQPVAIFAESGRPIGRVGRVDPPLVGAALQLDAPVVPIAVRRRALSRRWFIEVDAPLETPRYRNALAVAEHAERVRSAVQDLLDG